MNFNRNLITAGGVALLTTVVVLGIFALSLRGHMGFKDGRFGDKDQMRSQMGEKMEKGWFGTKGGCNQKDEKGMGMNKMGKMGAMFGMMNAKASPEMQKLLDELRTARENGDSAKVTTLREQIQKQREADQAAQEKALKNALAGGYEQWKAYATKQGAPAALFQKITPANFQTFVEMHTMKQKMRELETQLENNNQKSTNTGSTL